jgi:probable rRNA maturation factor
MPSETRRRATRLPPPVVPTPAQAPTETEPPQRLCLAVVAEAGDWTTFGAIDRAILAAGTALASAPPVVLAVGSEACIVLGDDALVRRLNATYRGKDAPTNVLAFPFVRPPGPGPQAAAYLGDVVLAAETVLREATAAGIEPAHHVQHLAIHGLLHLLGYDHDSAAAAEAMERLETEILATLGVADPHGAAAA